MFLALCSTVVSVIPYERIEIDRPVRPGYAVGYGHGWNNWNGYGYGRGVGWNGAYAPYKW